MCKACSFAQIMQEIALFSGQIYTAGTNFTRPLVAMVVTNLNSDPKFLFNKTKAKLHASFVIINIYLIYRCFEIPCASYKHYLFINQEYKQLFEKKRPEYERERKKDCANSDPKCTIHIVTILKI